MFVVWIAEHVFPYYTYSISLPPSHCLGTLALITPWLPRQINSQRSWGSWKPHAKSLPHTTPCHVSHAASRFPYKLSHCPPFDNLHLAYLVSFVLRWALTESDSTSELLKGRPPTQGGNGR